MGDYDEIKKFGKEVMERHGWELEVNFNSHRWGAKTWVDQLWIHPEKRLMCLMEEKYGEDSLSESQEELWCEVLGKHFPEGVFYAIVSSKEDWEAVAKLGRS